MTAETTMLPVLVRVIKRLVLKTIALVEQVVSISCPALGSIAANAPNVLIKEGLARA